MFRRFTALLLVLTVVGLAGCSPDNECVSNDDCFSGEFCNSNGVCKKQKTSDTQTGSDTGEEADAAPGSDTGDDEMDARPSSDPGCRGPDAACSCNFTGKSTGVCSRGRRDPETGDCNPPSNYEADESTCDGVDNDCDGQVDEELTTTYYHDGDGDGYGDPMDTEEACTQPKDHVTNPDDCYDENKEARPKQTKYFKEHRGDMSFDYDCNQNEEKFQTDRYRCKGTTKSTCEIDEHGWHSEDPPNCGEKSLWVTSCTWRDDFMMPVCTQGSGPQKRQRCR